jgi:hypothetical protein
MKFLECRIAQVGPLEKVNKEYSTYEVIQVMAGAMQLEFAEFSKVYFETFKH